MLSMTAIGDAHHERKARANVTPTFAVLLFLTQAERAAGIENGQQGQLRTLYEKSRVLRRPQGHSRGQIAILWVTMETTDAEEGEDAQSQ